MQAMGVSSDGGIIPRGGFNTMGAPSIYQQHDLLDPSVVSKGIQSLKEQMAEVQRDAI